MSASCPKAALIAITSPPQAGVAHAPWANGAEIGQAAVVFRPRSTRENDGPRAVLKDPEGNRERFLLRPPRYPSVQH